MEISNIWFDDKNNFLKTKQGVEKSMPLKWFPRLEKATEQQRQNFELSPFGNHWKEIENNLRYSYCSEISCSTGN